MDPKHKTKGRNPRWTARELKNEGVRIKEPHALCSPRPPVHHPLATCRSLDYHHSLLSLSLPCKPKVRKGNGLGFQELSQQERGFVTHSIDADRPSTMNGYHCSGPGKRPLGHWPRQGCMSFIGLGQF
jgi:hypothetical protein